MKWHGRVLPRKGSLPPIRLMIFLFEQQTQVYEYQFQAANYGPFSWRLSNALDFLVSNGLVNETKEPFLDGSERCLYSLTHDGLALVKETLSKDSRYEEYLETMTALKEKYNDLSLPKLLREVYSKYPDYAAKSQYEF